MANGEAKTLADVRSFLERQKFETSDVEEQHCTKVTVRSGRHEGFVSVYNTGKMVIGGKESALKALLVQMKDAIDNGGALPGQMLPFEIDRFPTTLRERVPDVDPVIARFLDESIACYRADGLLGAAFMLGAASERAIGLLIDAYVEAIDDQANRDRLRGRIDGKGISKQFDEFKKSYAGCQTKPADPLYNDIDVVIGSAFQFYRMTRNAVGHPHIPPDLDKGVLLANLGQFVTYTERLYALIAHFKATPMTV